MEDKTCTQCGEEKAVGDFEFRADRQMHRTQCINCRRAKGREWERTRRGVRNGVSRAEKCKRWRQANKDRVREYKTNVERASDKHLARRALHGAIKSGELCRPDHCSSCKGTHRLPIEAHHADYSRPLEVEWLCRDCHQYAHRMADDPT